VWPSIGRIGLPDPALASPFPARLRGFPPTTVPLNFRKGFILSCAYRPLQSLSRHNPVGAFQQPTTFPGVSLPHRGITSGVYDAARLSLRSATRASQAHFVPSSTLLTSSTASSSADVASLFHPAATSGLRPSGFFPREKPCRLVACLCPLVVMRVAFPDLAAEGEATSTRLQGFALLTSPLQTAVV